MHGSAVTKGPRGGYGGRWEGTKGDGNAAAYIRFLLAIRLPDDGNTLDLFQPFILKERRTHKKEDFPRYLDAAGIMYQAGMQEAE